MVSTAEKYRGIQGCGAGPRFAYSPWPSASRNEQRSSTNDQHEQGQRVEAVVSLCRCGENIRSIPVVQSSESTYNFVSSCLRGENQFYTPGSQLPSSVTAYSYAISVTYPQGANGLPAGTTNYIYYDSQWQVLEVRTGGTAASNVTEQMVWSAAYVNAAVLQDSYYNGVLQANQRLYFLQDANWNTTAVVGYNATAGTWQVTQRYVYSPYGNIIVLNADWSTPPVGTSPIVNNLYQGMSYDAVTGLYYERARWYSPSLGTWTSQDPLQYINGANTYQFVMGNPIGATDPLGLCVPCYKCQQILDQEEAQSIQQIKQEAIGLGLPGSLSAFKIVGSSIVLAGADSIWGGLFTESIGALLGGAEALGKIAELNGLMDLQDAEIKSDIAAYNHCMANCSN